MLHSHWQESKHITVFLLSYFTDHCKEDILDSGHIYLLCGVSISIACWGIERICMSCTCMHGSHGWQPTYLDREIISLIPILILCAWLHYHYMASMYDYHIKSCYFHSEAYSLHFTLHLYVQSKHIDLVIPKKIECTLHRINPSWGIESRHNPYRWWRLSLYLVYFVFTQSEFHDKKSLSAG